MSKTLITILVFLVLCISADQVSASSSHQLIMKSFRFSYDKTGLPNVDLSIENQGTVEEHPLVFIALNEVLSTSQNDYLLRKLITIKNDDFPVILPGKTGIVTLPVDMMLNAGEYEAQITLSYSETREQNQFEFSVNSAEVSLANEHLKANGRKQTVGKYSLSGRNWQVSLLVAVLAVFLLLKTLIVKPANISKREDKQSSNIR